MKRVLFAVATLASFNGWADPSPSAAPSVAASAAPSAHVFPSASVSPTVTVTPSPSASAGGVNAPLTLAEKKSLMSEYNRAQANEEAALRHVSRSQMRELTAAQSQKNRTWHETEKKQRREFFDKHESGPERRDYVQKYIQRKKEFDASQKTEYETARKTWSDKVEQLKSRQKDQRKKFKALVEQGQRPGPELWPN